MRHVMGHQGAWRGCVPSFDLIEPLLERSDPHWYWLGDFFDDGEYRCAVFPWTTPVGDHVRYVVARLAWEHANPGKRLEPRRVFRNTCELLTCVNPAHFARMPTKAELLSIPMTIDESFRLDGMRPQLRSRGKEIDGILINDRAVHIGFDNAPTAVCGMLMGGQLLRVTGTPVTCKGCLNAWYSLGRPLVEVVLS